MNKEKIFLIWSNEQFSWWAENKMGYVIDPKDAGRYSETEAIEICQDANKCIPSYKVQNEIMVRIQ